MGQKYDIVVKLCNGSGLFFMPKNKTGNFSCFSGAGDTLRLNDNGGGSCAR